MDGRVFGLLGIVPGAGLLGEFITATIVAVILLLLIRLIKRA